MLIRTLPPVAALYGSYTLSIVDKRESIMGKRAPILIGLLLLILAIWVQLTPIAPVRFLVDRLENLTYDWQLRTNFLAHHPSIKSPIVIVDIDDRTLEKIGRWPWSRAKLAIITNNLIRAGAVVIAYDAIFPQAEENMADQLLQESTQRGLLTSPIKSFIQNISPFVDNDEKFAASLKKTDAILGLGFTQDARLQNPLPKPAIVLTTKDEQDLKFIKEEGVVSNVLPLQYAAKSAGFINDFPDEDGIIRHAPVLIRYQNALYPSLAVEAVRLFLLSDIQLVTAPYGHQMKLEGIKINNILIPTDERGEVIIPFRGRAFTFPSLSALDVINNTFSPQSVEGKIVFVGASATGLNDLKPTAIQNAFPGTEILATIANGILTHEFYYKPAWSFGAEISVTFLVGMLFVLFFPYLEPRLLGFLMILIPSALIVITDIIWDKTGLIISVFIPIALTFAIAITNITLGYFLEKRQRKRLKKMFKHYVPTKHIEEMMRSSGEYNLLGEVRDMTVFFSDIRKFTAISEKLPIAEMQKLINEFLTAMTEIIFKYRGTIDKYVGDSIMAFWGAPLKDSKHTQHAIQAALEMQRVLKKMNQSFAEKNWPKIKMGIGLNSGLMSVGDMGSKYRLNYTVLGDAVNLASRVETLTKYYGVEIIVTEHTKKDQTLFIFRKLDRIKVVGKETSVEIYEPLCLASQATPELLKTVELYHRALAHYFAKEWHDARFLFGELTASHPYTKLYSLFLERIANYQKNPPPENWDGVFVHVNK